jgi:Flp pilus assembly pilin Flp
LVFEETKALSGFKQIGVADAYSSVGPVYQEENMKLPINLWKEEQGQDLIEYGLLLVLVALLSVSFVTSIGTALSKVFSNANTALQGATS